LFSTQVNTVLHAGRKNMVKSDPVKRRLKKLVGALPYRDPKRHQRTVPQIVWYCPIEEKKLKLAEHSPKKSLKTSFLVEMMKTYPHWPNSLYSL
jgi:hypothetical protein